jgi:hypothetical protein
MSDSIKIYVVLEQGFMYNDNTYELIEGTTTRKAFIRKEEAVEECNKLSIQALKDFNNLSDLDVYNLDEDGHLFEKITKYGGMCPSKNSREIILPENLTDEQALDILKSLSVQFFYVQAIELE